MNTIPLIFNERRISHTVVKGNGNLSDIKMPVTCILLNRGINQFKSKVFKNLLSKGFAEIISVEQKTSGSDTEELAADFPQIHFLIALEDVNEGDMLNLGMAHASYKYVLVLQEEQCTSDFNFSPMIAKKLMDKDVFCVCPRLETENYGNLTVCFEPFIEKKVFKIKEKPVCNDGDATLYSVDYAGFYNREKYIQLGGIDYTIESGYWQKIDFFLRAWLWGEKTVVSHSFILRYSSMNLNFDQTPDETYMRFYLKNLIPVYKIDHAYISKKSFFIFYLRSPFRLSDSINIFKDAQNWILKNQYRFKMDAVSLINNWGN